MRTSSNIARNNNGPLETNEYSTACGANIVQDVQLYIVELHAKIFDVTSSTKFDRAG